ncbi:MAG TPA: DoxX family protein [Stellaceae bacterium]|jgi:putative oxidoreductase|nr:DoxX family protein [Stellaceae bacterium]
MSDSKRGSRPRLFFPRLESFYQSVSGLAYPFIRFVTGAMLVPHGWRKFVDSGTQKATIELFHKLGIEPARLLFWLVGSLELFGGLMLAIGLFTRPVALAIAIEMLVISLDVFWPNGFFAGTRGYEHTLLWGLIALAIAARGGGKQSVDQLIGKEF